MSDNAPALARDEPAPGNAPAFGGDHPMREEADDEAWLLADAAATADALDDAWA